MGRTHLTTLTMLFVATIGSLAGAQASTKKTAPATPPKTTTTVAPTKITTTATAPAPAPAAPAAVAAAATDSAVPDSLKPKKKSRFGGLMSRAKNVANSKAG